MTTREEQVAMVSEVIRLTCLGPMYWHGIVATFPQNLQYNCYRNSFRGQ
jgi:hypothetical protein